MLQFFDIIGFMEKYILDVNLFFNLQSGLNMGKKTEEVIRSLTQKTILLKRKNKAEFYMPPRIIEEFLSFFEDKNQDFIKDFLSSITVKSPDLGREKISSQIFYQIIQDVRERNYKGLNIGEEEIEKAGLMMLGKEAPSKKEFQIQIGAIIKKFRERYRQATRTGFLDSLADLDLIVLAKELDGFLISTDEGVIKWGRIFGVKEVPVETWAKKLEDLSHSF